MTDKHYDFLNVSQQFNIDIIGITSCFNGCGYKITLEELHDMLGKPSKCCQIKDINVQKFEVIVDSIIYDERSRN
uniref:ORFan n=1 Tax=Strongyloides venezuelensis TaxID=75913 RepID=A0A0K0F291_STRVS